jgi:AraC-like DNA-binding protein
MAASAPIVAETARSPLEDRCPIGLRRRYSRSAVLIRNRLVDVDGVTVHDVVCGSARGPWSEPECGATYGIVFVRRGSFRRRANGADDLIDPTTAYFERPRDEQQIAHPMEGGDVCTSIVFRPQAIAAMWGGDPELPDRPAAIEPSVDLQHRLLLRACRRGDAFDVAERTHLLATAVLEAIHGGRVASGRPATRVARQRVVDGAREALGADPTMGLAQLARTVNVSPHHLSRIFRDHTGSSLSRYHSRLRVHLALERLAGGERDLAAMAAELGFSDHSHMGRAIRQELGHTPSELRSALADTA